jgi:hypothetical protein
MVTPVVYQTDRGLSWDRNTHVILSVTSLPFIVYIFVDDAYYSKPGSVDVPPLAVAAIIGVVIAAIVRWFTVVDSPPRWQGAFAGIGFIVALAWIYAVSDEVCVWGGGGGGGPVMRPPQPK